MATVLLSLLMVLLPALASAQLMMGGGKAAVAINGFTYCRKVTIDHTKIPNTVVDGPQPADLSKFPVLFDSKINPELQADLKLVANDGIVTSSSGHDILFFPDALGGAGEAKIAHKKVVYNGTTGEYIARLPLTLSALVDTAFWACAGNSSITTSQEDIAGVYDLTYKGVWDFGDGTTLSLLDSTSNANDGTNVNGVTAVPGKVGGAAHFDGDTGQFIGLGNPSALSSIADSRTVTFWYHLNAAPPPIPGKDFGGSYYIFRKVGEGNGMGFFIGKVGEYASNIRNGVNAQLVSVSSGGMQVNENVEPLAGDTKHVAFVYNRTIHTASLFVNGTLVGTYDYYPSVQNVDYDAVIGDTMNGWIDEMTVSNVARHSDYIRTAYLMEANPGGIVTVGPRL